MTIATWNIQRAPIGRQVAIVECMQEIDADVWVLTETDAQVRPGDDYRDVATLEDDREYARESERWTTIWSRLPLQRLADTSDPSRAVAALVEPPTGRALIVYGTVLAWVGSRWRDVPSTGGESFRAALKAQRSDWVRLREEYPDADFCVAGDLNQDLSTRHYYGSGRNREELQEALGVAGLYPLTADPNDPVRTISTDRASIDHICVSERLRENVSLRAWPGGPKPALSDHFGVAATLDPR